MQAFKNSADQGQRVVLPANVERGPVLLRNFAELAQAGFKRVGILGGSFDPPHQGHIILAQVALRAGLDCVVFIPAYHNPLKPKAPIASAQQRSELVQMAVQSEPRFFVSDLELQRGQQSGQSSFTIETVREIKRQSGGQLDLFLIVGADCLADLKQWREVDDLLKQLQIMPVRRAGFPKSALDSLEPRLGAELVAKLKANFVDETIPDIASRNLRESLARGEVAEDLLPTAVADYLKKAPGIYRDQGLVKATVS